MIKMENAAIIEISKNGEIKHIYLVCDSDDAEQMIRDIIKPIIQTQKEGLRK